jgi:hypothetical protein
MLNFDGTIWFACLICMISDTHMPTFLIRKNYIRGLRFHDLGSPELIITMK